MDLRTKTKVSYFSKLYASRMPYQVGVNNLLLDARSHVSADVEDGLIHTK